MITNNETKRNNDAEMLKSNQHDETMTSQTMNQKETTKH